MVAQMVLLCICYLSTVFFFLHNVLSLLKEILVHWDMAMFFIGINTRDKRTPKLSNSKDLKYLIFYYYPGFYKFVKVHETEYDQLFSLVKEAQHVLYLIHTRDKNNKNSNETKRFHTSLSHSKEKDIQHVKMNWYYRKFTCHPVAA